MSLIKSLLFTLLLALWMAWASTSFPVPLSPVIKMVEGLSEMLRAYSFTHRISLLRPIISSKV